MFPRECVGDSVGQRSRSQHGLHFAGGGLTVANGGKIAQSIPLVFGLAVPYAIFGAFLAAQRPESRMGWVLYAPGAAISFTLLAGGYAEIGR
ncbi:MAG: hypothetical protein KY432_05250, partial [Acidobacteria bacterium]|nr:hypothetical protein [Acidobacteriota bacterium]